MELTVEQPLLFAAGRCCCLRLPFVFQIVFYAGNVSFSFSQNCFNTLPSF